MLIEEIFEQFWSEKGKISIFVLGIIMALIGFITSYLLFDNRFLPIVFFTTLTLVPFVNITFKEKMKNVDMGVMYILLFAGMIIVFVIVNYFFGITKLVYFSSEVGKPYLNFSVILINNTKLIFISFLLSILFGIGAIFILTLNAAVIGQLFAGFIAANKYATLMAFIPHTMVELIGYLLAAISGGLLVRAFVKYKKKEFGEKVLQASVFFSLSITTIIVAAFLEVFVLPLLL